jgi:predicted nucleotidyltransferase
MESQSLACREPDAAKLLDQIVVDPEFREYLLGFYLKMVEGYSNEKSDPFGVGLNHFGIQNVTYPVPGNVHQLLQAAEILDGEALLSDESSVGLTAQNLRYKIAGYQLSEINICPDGSNAGEAMSRLHLLLNECFVYTSRCVNGGYKSPRTYSMCGVRFHVSEQAVHDVLSKCMLAIRSAFANANMVDYFEVVERWQSIYDFITKQDLSSQDVSLAGTINQEVRRNHQAITPDRIEGDLGADKSRIAEARRLEDAQIAVAIEEQKQSVRGQIEDALSRWMGIKRGEEFTGLSSDTDLDSVFDDFARISGSRKPNREFDRQFRQKHRDPDRELSHYFRVYERNIIGEIVKAVAGICNPVKVYVFGSIAKGTFDDQSDLDLFVVVDDNADVDSLYEKLGQAGLTTGNDVVLRKNSEFIENNGKIEMLDSVVNLEGKVVYERK